MFVGREKELNRMYKSNNFQFAVIYGRRRIGKTTLIQKFIEDKEAIYFVGLEENAHDNLVRLSTAIVNFENDSNLSEVSLGSFENCFREIAQIAQNKKVVLVIDEYLI